MEVSTWLISLNKENYRKINLGWLWNELKIGIACGQIQKSFQNYAKMWFRLNSNSRAKYDQTKIELTRRWSK